MSTPSVLGHDMEMSMAPLAPDRPHIGLKLILCLALSEGKVSLCSRTLFGVQHQAPLGRHPTPFSGHAAGPPLVSEVSFLSSPGRIALGNPSTLPFGGLTAGLMLYMGVNLSLVIADLDGAVR
jgi:hypothetical protein